MKIFVSVSRHFNCTSREREREGGRERMCGRARCCLNATQVARACGLPAGEADSVRTIQMDQFRPSYNVSPGSYLPVFTADVKGHAAQAEEACHAVHSMKWGLVPSFTKKTEKPDHYRMFNARSESVKEKPSFRRLIPNNRCLVAVEGFYEWKKDGSKKQPYYIHFKDGRPLVFAALYDSWQNSEGEILYTFTILTTRSSPALEWLHDRMPVIFGSKGTTEMWLSDSQPKLETVLTPYADSDLVWYPVTPAMGKSSFDGPVCIKEIPLKPVVQNQISKLFSRKTDDNICKCKSEPDVFPENVEPNNLKEEPATEDTEELADEKKVFREELHGIKREFEDMAPNLQIETEVLERYSTSVKKKPQTGDKQISLLSYFGKK